MRSEAHMCTYIYIFVYICTHSICQARHTHKRKRIVTHYDLINCVDIVYSPTCTFDFIENTHRQTYIRELHVVFVLPVRFCGCDVPSFHTALFSRPAGKITDACVNKHKHQRATRAVFAFWMCCPKLWANLIRRILISLCVFKYHAMSALCERLFNQSQAIVNAASQRREACNAYELSRVNIAVNSLHRVEPLVCRSQTKFLLSTFGTACRPEGKMRHQAR